MNVPVLAAYSLAVSLVVAVAAWLAERAFAGLRLPTRGGWIGALCLTIWLPLAAILSGSSQRDAAVAASSTQTVANMPRDGLEIDAGDGSGPERFRVVGLLADWMVGFNEALASGAMRIPAGHRVEAWTASVWGAASILAAVAILASMLRLHRRAGAWPERMLFGRSVKVSPDTGPATIGPLRPKVVVPRWAIDLPPHELELVIRHEGEHVRARDTLLLAIGLVAVVGCPWNPLVWWQVRRLKDAVEVDCDRRILRSGVESARYGDLLVRLGSRARLESLANPAIAGAKGQLERRLGAMLAACERVSMMRVAAAMSLALLLIAVACATDAPVATEAEGASDEQRQQVVAIRLDPDGVLRVDDVEQPIDRVSEILALYDEDTVVSLELHPAVRYGAVSALQDELRAAGVVRVVFATAEPEDRSSAADDASRLVDGGLPIVLPGPAMPDPRRTTVSARNLLFLDVLPTGMVRVSGGEENGVREVTPRDVEVVWRRNVALNPNLIAVARTHPDAQYQYMYDVLDALHEAEATRISLQVAH